MGESRKQFERWWEVNYHNGKPPRFGWEYWRDGGEYKVEEDGGEFDGMWKAWQASRAVIEIELPSLKQTDSGERYVWSDGVYNFKNDAVTAIESTGLKVKK